MACPTCSHTMQKLGRVKDMAGGYYWCPRCGTLAFFGETPGDVECHPPALVERCHEFYRQAIAAKTERQADVWRRVGVAESINLPKDRN